MAWEELSSLQTEARNWPQLERILMANVAGVAGEARLQQALPELDWSRLERIRSLPGAAGVSNGYRVPEQLGVDRWCALIGAWALEQRACLVVTAGTATTVDSLDASGRFLGGLILPGVDLMKGALAKGTAGLPWAQGQHVPFPNATDDAITTGCLEAQAGAIERAFARLPGAECCLLSGGAAPLLEPLLRLPVRPVHDLVLEGLRRLAQDL